VFGNRSAPVLASDAPCANLAPERWRQGVAHAPDPAPAPPGPVAPPLGASDAAQRDHWRSMYNWAFAELQKWAAFGVAEAQRVEDANGRINDVIEIVGGCERRNARAVAEAGR
jgi:hypothetical protein